MQMSSFRCFQMKMYIRNIGMNRPVINLDNNIGVGMLTFWAALHLLAQPEIKKEGDKIFLRL